MSKPRRTRPPFRAPLDGAVYCAFAVTGGGTDYLVGIYAHPADAKAAVAREESNGRTGWVVKRKVR